MVIFYRIEAALERVNDIWINLITSDIIFYYIIVYDYKYFKK